ncbi:MAG: YncE family protein [Spirochaetota bacterium]
MRRKNNRVPAAWCIAALLILAAPVLPAWAQDTVQAHVQEAPAGERREPQHPASSRLPRLEVRDMQVLQARVGTKSVWLSPDRSRVYTLNLETLSVQEFDRAARSLAREIRFKPHPGKGYNYQEKREFDSLQEKPVEACFTHGGRYLWVSLHNAGGVVVWDLRDTDTAVEGRPFKEVTLHDYRAGTSTPGRLLWIRTGRTPKVITASRDGRLLFVSNWHDGTVSVISIRGEEPASWEKVADIPGGRIPRGMAVSEDGGLLYVADMGGNSITAVDLDTLRAVSSIRVDPNPRHLTIDGRFVYVSINSGARILKVDLEEERVVASAETERTPRTIQLSPDGSLLFVTCYYPDRVQAFTAGGLELAGSWDSAERPVGIDVYQEGDLLELWVANYRSGTVKVIVLERDPERD